MADPTSALASFDDEELGALVEAITQMGITDRVPSDDEVAEAVRRSGIELRGRDAAATLQYVSLDELEAIPGLAEGLRSWYAAFEAPELHEPRPTIADFLADRLDRARAALSQVLEDVRLGVTPAVSYASDLPLSVEVIEVQPGGEIDDPTPLRRLFGLGVAAGIGSEAPPTFELSGVDPALVGVVLLARVDGDATRSALEAGTASIPLPDGRPTEPERFVLGLLLD